MNGVLVRRFMMWIKHRGRTPQFLLCISSRYDLCPLGLQLPHLSNGGRPGFRKIQLSLYTQGTKEILKAWSVSPRTDRRTQAHVCSVFNLGRGGVQVSQGDPMSPGPGGGKVGNKPRVAFSPAACPHVTRVTVMSTLQGTQGSRYFTYNWLRC